MQEYIELVKAIPEFKPLVALTIANLKEYDAEYNLIKDFVINQQIDAKSRIYLGLIEKGIPADHALALTVGVMNEIEKQVKQASTKKSK